MSLIKVNQLATLDGAVSREVKASTGLTIPVGEDLKIEGSILDKDGSSGFTGQFLTSTNGGLNVSWTSLPQNISPTSDVTFANIVVSGDITIGGTANFSLEESEGNTILGIVSKGPLTDLKVDNATDGFVVTTIVVSSNTATINAAGHNFSIGDRISLTNTSEETLDNIYVVNGRTLNTITVTTAGVISGNYTGGRVKPVAVFTGDVVIDGSINVNGTNIGLSDLFVGAGLIRLNSGKAQDEIPSIDGSDDAKIEVNRGALNTTALKWNELTRRWQFTNDGLNYNNILLPSETDFGASEQFGASGDPNRYDAIQVSDEVINNFTYKKIRIPDITKFLSNHRVKAFGISPTQDISTSTPVPNRPSIVTASVENVVFNDQVTFPKPRQWYAYAIAQFDLVTGDVSAATTQSVSPVINMNVTDLNEANYNTISVTRNANKGILIYRGLFSSITEANAALADYPESASLFKLISVLGPRYFGGVNNYQYIDYGSYDLTPTNQKNPDGSFGGTEVHFPHTAPIANRQGWITCGILPDSINVSDGTLILDVPSLFSDANINNIFLYHDDTVPLQTAIDQAVSEGRNFLVIPGGTYLISQLRLPDRFTLRGLADASILHKQYWDTNNITGNIRNGIRNSMLVSAKYNATIPPVNTSTGENNWGLSETSIGDIVIDGNKKYQILNDLSILGPNANDSAINLVNSEFCRIQNVKIRSTYGSALFASGSENFTIDGSLFYAGCEEERFQTPCLEIEEGDTTIITSSIFRDFPGPLSVTATEVLVVNGCTIRNCGSGLRLFGSSKTDVLNNLILGPADEYLPVPDLYDSEFNSINLQVQFGLNNQTPVFQYIVAGQEVDLSNAVTRVECFRVTKQGIEEVIDFLNPITAPDGNDLFSIINPGSIYDPTIGQTQFEISIQNTNYLFVTFPPQPNAYNVYRVYGIKYFDYGTDISPTLGQGRINVSGVYNLDVNKIVYDSVIVGSYIKLVSHSYNPQPSIPNRIWLVQGKINLGGNSYALNLLPYVEDALGNIEPSTLTGVGLEPTPGGGYAQVRDKFIIAKGLISITV